MKIGVPKEIKTLEFRVGMTPAGVQEVISDGHEVTVETNAGSGIGVTDADYEAVGASVVATAKEVFDAAEMIVKVKEPQLNECEMLRPDQVLFTYLHLAADPAQTEALVKSGTTAIAYETVTADDRSLPLLTPMSEVAGRLSIQCGAFALHKANGGSGKLLGGVPGVAPAKVLVIGGGVSGLNAADMAVGLGVGYRIDSEPRWHLNALTNYALGIYEPVDQNEVFKSGIQPNLSCPGPPLHQRSDTGPLVLVDADTQRLPGHSSPALLLTYEQAATRLEQDGWQVWRRYRPGNPDSNDTRDQLVEVRLFATNGKDFISTQFFNDAAQQTTHSSTCLAERSFFGNPTSEHIVDKFTPDLIPKS